MGLVSHHLSRYTAPTMGNHYVILKHWRTVATTLSVLPLLTACGHYGSLYPPGKETPYGPANYSIMHSTSYYQQQEQKKKQQDNQTDKENKSSQTVANSEQNKDTAKQKSQNPESTGS